MHIVHALQSAHTQTQIAKHIITKTHAGTGLPAVILALAGVKSAWCIQWLQWNMCTSQKMKLHYGHWVHTGCFKQFFLISSVKKKEGLNTNRDVVPQNSYWPVFSLILSRTFMCAFLQMYIVWIAIYQILASRKHVQGSCSHSCSSATDDNRWDICRNHTPNEHSQYISGKFVSKVEKAKRSWKCPNKVPSYIPPALCVK